LYNIYYKFLSLSLTLIIPSKELTLLDKLYFLGTCFLYSNSVFSMNFFMPFYLKRAAKIRTFS